MDEWGPLCEFRAYRERPQMAWGESLIALVRRTELARSHEKVGIFDRPLVAGSLGHGPERIPPDKLNGDEQGSADRQVSGTGSVGSGDSPSTASTAA